MSSFLSVYVLLNLLLTNSISAMTNYVDPCITTNVNITTNPVLIITNVTAESSISCSINLLVYDTNALSIELLNSVENNPFSYIYFERLVQNSYNNCSKKYELLPGYKTSCTKNIFTDKILKINFQNAHTRMLISATNASEYICSRSLAKTNFQNLVVLQNQPAMSL